MKTKDEVRKEFEEYCSVEMIYLVAFDDDLIFNWFYDIIDSIQKENKELRKALITRDGNLTQKILTQKALNDGFVAGRSEQSFESFKKEWYNEQKSPAS